MIICHANLLKSYYCLNPLFSEVQKYITNNELTELPLGEREILGRKLYLNSIETQGRGKTKAKLERHNKYIDIHLTLSGEDLIGWKQQNNCQQSNGYQQDMDVEIYDDTQISHWISVPTNYMAIFFPEDAHAPQANESLIKKIVFKVAI